MPSLNIANAFYERASPIVVASSYYSYLMRHATHDWTDTFRLNPFNYKLYKRFLIIYSRRNNLIMNTKYSQQQRG